MCMATNLRHAPKAVRAAWACGSQHGHLDTRELGPEETTHTLSHTKMQKHRYLLTDTHRNHINILMQRRGEMNPPFSFAFRMSCSVNHKVVVWLAAAISTSVWSLPPWQALLFPGATMLMYLRGAVMLVDTAGRGLVWGGKEGSSTLMEVWERRTALWSISSMSLTQGKILFNINMKKEIWPDSCNAYCKLQTVIWSKKH